MSLLKIAGFGLTATGLLAVRLHYKGGVNHHAPDMAGKTVIVTGGNSGIGLEAARELYSLNANVIITGRDERKAKKFLDSLPEPSNGQDELKFYKLDFSDLENVEDFTRKLKGNYDKVDLLINNAGANFMEYRTTAQGYEMTMGVNHLAHAYLTSLLLPELTKGQEARVINVAFQAHLGREQMKGNPNPEFEDFFSNQEGVDHAETYNWYNRYGQSKLANILFTRGLAKHIEEENAKGKALNLKTVSLHPGVILTDFMRSFDQLELKSRILFKVFSPLMFMFFKTVNDGAQTTLHCALCPFDELVNGEYYSDCRIRETTPQAQDPVNIDTAWDITNKALKESLDYDAFVF